MRQTIFLLLVLTTITLSLACKTADKALSDRDYDKAYKLSMKALKKEKSVKENKRILEKSLTEIIKREELEIAELSNSKDLEKWDKALNVNLDLQEKIEQATTYLGNIFSHEYYQLEANYTELRDELSAIYFNTGVEDLEKAIAENDKLLAQDAYHHFVTSENYGNEDERLDSLKAASLDAGLLIYVVDANRNFDYDWEINRRFDNIESYSNEFRSIYYNQNASDVDCSIEIAFGTLAVGYDERSDSRTFRESVVVGTETQVDTAGNQTQVNVYETVEGRVFTVERVKILDWEVEVDVRAHTNNCVLRSDRFRAAVRSTIEEYRLEGDQRAIPARYQRGNTDEFEDTDDMAEDLIEALYRDVVGSLF